MCKFLVCFVIFMVLIMQINALPRQKPSNSMARRHHTPHSELPKPENKKLEEYVINEELPENVQEFSNFTNPNNETHNLIQTQNKHTNKTGSTRGRKSRFTNTADDEKNQSDIKQQTKVAKKADEGAYHQNFSNRKNEDVNTRKTLLKITNDDKLNAAIDPPTIQKPTFALSDLINNIGLKHPKAINSFSYSENESTRICWFERVFAQFDLHGKLGHTWVEYEVIFETPSIENDDEVDLMEEKNLSQIDILDPYTNITEKRAFKMYWKNQNTSIWVNEMRRCGKANHLDKTYKEELDGSAKYLSIRLTNKVREDLVPEDILKAENEFMQSEEVNESWKNVGENSIVNNKNFNAIKYNITPKYEGLQTTTEKLPKFVRNGKKEFNTDENYRELKNSLAAKTSANTGTIVGSPQEIINSGSSSKQKLPSNKNTPTESTFENDIPNYFSNSQDNVLKFYSTNPTYMQINGEDKMETTESDDQVDMEDWTEEEYGEYEEPEATAEAIVAETLNSTTNKPRTVREKTECPPSLTNILINSKFLPHLCTIQVNDKDTINVKGSFMATKKALEIVNGMEVEVEKPLFELNENTQIKVFDN